MELVLAAKRISRDTETSSALERQDRDLHAAVTQRGARLVHMVEDATVSGAVHLDERKALGEWLREPKVHEWTTLMVTEQDRITRDDLHWWQFVGWVLERGKTVVVLDDPSLDLATEDGRMIAGIKASQAAKYRRSVQTKRLGQTEYFREEDLWPGGQWPFGYRAEQFIHKGRRRWRLVVDPITSALVLEAYELLVNRPASEEWSFTKIVKLWNARGELTPRDHQRRVNAQLDRVGTATEIRGAKWTVPSLRNALVSRALCGFSMHRREVRRRDGKPVQWAEPILTLEQHDKLCAVIEVRGASQRGLKVTGTPLRKVLWCACGLVLHSHSLKKQASVYRCSSRTSVRCEHITGWPRPFIEAHIDARIDNAIGDLEVVEMRYVPGRDKTSQIAELRLAIANQTRALSFVSGDAALEAISATLNEYSAELAQLEVEPVVPPTWEVVPTGQTYGELWTSFGDDWEAKGRFLRTAGVKFRFAGTWRTPRIDVEWPEDIASRLHLRDGERGGLPEHTLTA